MFHGSQKRYFGEGHVLIDLFVSHIPSGEKFDGWNIAQLRLYVKQYRIFIMIIPEFFMQFLTDQSPEKFGVVSSLGPPRGRSSMNGSGKIGVAGASISRSCSVSTSRSSNLTGGFPASGSRTRLHAFAHGRLCVLCGK
jgi:hypothetical protein